MSLSQDPAFTYDELRAALELICSELPDREKIQSLETTLKPEQNQRMFGSNGWQRSLASFRQVPDWSTAKEDIAILMGYRVGEKPSFHSTVHHHKKELTLLHVPEGVDLHQLLSRKLCH
jgi:hypothetical protein